MSRSHLHFSHTVGDFVFVGGAKKKEGTPDHRLFSIMPKILEKSEISIGNRFLPTGKFGILTDL